MADGAKFSSNNERRLAIIGIRSDDVLEQAFFAWPTQQFYRVLTHDSLPDGCKVERVWFDQANDEFKFFLSHPSFAEVRRGERIPRLDLELKWEGREVPKE